MSLKPLLRLLFNSVLLRISSISNSSTFILCSMNFFTAVSIKFDIGVLKGEAGTTGVVRNGYDYAKGLESSHPYIRYNFDRRERELEQRLYKLMDRKIKQIGKK